MQDAFSSIVFGILNPVVSLISALLKAVFIGGVLFLLVFFLVFFVRYRFNPFALTAAALRKPYIKSKRFDLVRWLLVDFLERKKHVGEFTQYGFTFFVGPQGAGKTASMVHYLEAIKRRYPDCVIVTNFGYYQADFVMKDWKDVLNVRNGTQGVVFAIDEIHSEYSSAAWKDVPESLLSEISQQRKQRVKIVATAQFFTRIAKPLREQASTVVLCKTWMGRWVKNREYDALRYALIMDNPNVIKKKLKPLRKSSFVLSDSLREAYDTYEKIERMKKIKFLPRADRGEN